MTQKTKDWDINDSQFPRLQVHIPHKKIIRERPYVMLRDTFWPFLTYLDLPSLKRPI